MSLMGNKDQIYVGTSISRLVKDDGVLSSVTTGNASGIHENKDPINFILEDLAAGIGVATKRFYNSATSKYLYGTPKGTTVTSYVDPTPVDAILTALEGYPIVSDYVLFGEQNYVHLAYKEITASEGYLHSTGELTNLSATKGHTVTLTKVILTMSQGLWDSLDTSSLTSDAGAFFVNTNPSYTTVHLSIEYEWTQLVLGIPTLFTETKDITSDLTLFGLEGNESFFQAGYVVAGVYKYWEYKLGTGTYSDLDTLFDGGVVENGTYLPRLYFRYNFVAGNADKNITWYKDSQKLAKIIKIDFDELCTQINDVGNNADVGYVIQSFLYFGVPIATTNKQEKDYVHRYLNRMYITDDGLPFVDRATLLASLAFYPHANIIKDSLFKLALSHQGIYKVISTGVIGKVGSHITEQGTTTIVLENLDSNSIWQPRNRSVTWFSSKKQISKTQYEELIVFGLTSTYFVFGDYSATGNDDTGSPILLVPIDISITKTMSLVDREILYQRSMYVVFNSKQVVKQKWYQSDAFAAILFIAAVVITVMSLGEAYQSIAIAQGITTFSLAVAIQAIIVVFGTQFIIAEGFKLLVKEVGADGALVLFALAVLAGRNDTAKYYLAVLHIQTPLQLLQFASGLISGATGAIGDSLADLQKEMDEFSDFAKLKWDELTKLQDELTSSNHWKPWMVLGESPDEYYKRTVHQGNIAADSIQSVHTYVRDLLQLPKPRDTLRGFV